MKSGKIIPQGNFSADTWVKIYENELATAQTSVTISGLDGNTDVMYRLIVRAISGNDANNIYLRFNADTGASYGTQILDGQDATSSARRYTGSTAINIYGLAGLSTNYISQNTTIIYAKSGYLRTCIGAFSFSISGTTVDCMSLFGSAWNNTADNFVSMTLLALNASGLGVGTVIELWKPVPKV